MADEKPTPGLKIDDYKYGFHDPENYPFKSGKGLSKEIVTTISEMKNEPGWMTDFRLKALEHFHARPMPQWGGGGMLETIDFQNIHYYVKPSDRAERSWEDVPADIKNTFDRLGIPEAEKKVPRRRRCPVRVRGHLSQLAGAVGQTRRRLPRHRQRSARARGHLQEILRQDHSLQRQQVRRSELRRLVGWIIYLRPQRRLGRYSASGILPHQHGKHGTIRAHADRRR